MKQIANKKGSLLEQLTKTNHRPFLEKQLDTLVASGLKKVSFSPGIDQEPFATFWLDLEEMSRTYKDKLSISITPNEILKELVQEANYALVVNKEMSTLVSRAMETLKEAEGHTRKFHEKSAVFVLGNTGSGKRTTVCWLLGAPLATENNKVGDLVLKLEGDDTDPAFPKIGQAIGESETLYTAAYPIKDWNNFVLGDCPGFRDTRGEDIELCTNLSIDRAVKKAQEIRSVLVIVPFHAFLLDRANAIIEIIDTVKERFPGTFDPEHPENNQRVFLLVTKAPMGSEGAKAVEALRDGTRFKEFLRENQERRDKLLMSCGL